MPRQPTTASSLSNGESNESSELRSSDPPEPKPDPLAELEELLDSEHFDDERISVIQVEMPARSESDRVSLMKGLRKKHPKVALVLTVLVASAVWAKVIVDALEAFK